MIPQKLTHDASSRSIPKRYFQTKLHFKNFKNNILLTCVE